jgi:hypothetical protein
MNRRDLLKLAPLAALAPAVVRVGNIEAQAYEVKPGKKYVFVLNNAFADFESAGSIQESFAKEARRCGIDGMMLINEAEGDLEIYELT